MFLKFSFGKIRVNKCDNVVILIKGKIVKKIINVKLDKNFFIVFLIKVESFRIERRIEVNIYSFYFWLVIFDWLFFDWLCENVVWFFYVNIDRVENLSKIMVMVMRIL